MFGSGGGYAGTLTTHYLLPNGQLFKSERIAGAKLAAGEVPAREARRLMERYREEISGHDFQQPGNRYFFIEYVSTDTTHAIQWGAPAADPPAAVLDFYETLQSLLPTEEATKK